MHPLAPSIVCLTALVAQGPPPSPPAAVLPDTIVANVTTVFEKQVSGRLNRVEGGKLYLEGGSIDSLPLDEVAQLELDYPQTLAIAWLGQDNRDVVQIGSSLAGNKIQDMHLRLTGVPFRRTIKQIVIVGRYPGQIRVWRLDPTHTPHWRIGLEKEPTSYTADLFLEPNLKDAFGLTFSVIITYDDGSTARLSTNATTHTSNELKVGAQAKIVGKQPPPSTTVRLEGGDLLRGELLSLGDETLTLKTAWAPDLRVPSLMVSLLSFDRVGPPEARQLLEAKAAERGREDTVLAIGRDQTIAPITGTVQSVADGKVTMLFEGQPRMLQQDRVVGIVLASRPDRPAERTSCQVFQLTSGETISGAWEGIAKEGLRLRTRWGQTLLFEHTQVRSIGTRNGKLVYLSDLPLAEVDEAPYFSRRFPFRRDQSLFGQPLVIGKKQYAKGLAVHARCVLTYELDGSYESFKSTLAFDRSSEGRGRVNVRVIADGKSVFARDDVRASQVPLPVEARLAGARTLALEVDFGEEEDVGDRVIWADARILRAGS